MHQLGELASRDAVFTHGKEFLNAISHGLQQFDVYEKKSASSYESENFFDLRDSDGTISTYSYDSHTSYSLKYNVANYHNLDDVKRLMSFGSILQFVDNHIVHCDHENPTLVGTILVGSSHGSWAKNNEVEHHVAHTLNNLLLHPSHLAVRVDKGLTLLRQVVRTENFESSGNKFCTKLHTESIHPVELFATMEIKTIAESPFQHMYGGSNLHPSTGMSAPSKQTRKMKSSFVVPTYKPCGTGEEDFYSEGSFVGCLQYSKDLPGSFNLNYNARTGGDD